MKKIIYFLLMIQLVFGNRIHYSDYCYGRKASTSEYNFYCLSGLYSKDESSCQGLKIWTIINSQIRSVKANRTLERFLQLIDECPEWSPKDVCLNKSICYRDFKIPFRLLNGGKKQTVQQTKCKCAGKYGFTCGQDRKYCATDREACSGLDLKESGISNCKT